MIELTEYEQRIVNELLSEVIDDPFYDNPEQGLFQIWDFLEQCDYSTHDVCSFVETNGQQLIGRALLSKMVDI
jgi:hypothetical protein